MASQDLSIATDYSIKSGLSGQGIFGGTWETVEVDHTLGIEAQHAIESAIGSVVRQLKQWTRGGEGGNEEDALELEQEPSPDSEPYRITTVRPPYYLVATAKSEGGLQGALVHLRREFESEQQLRDAVRRNLGAQPRRLRSVDAELKAVYLSASTLSGAVYHPHFVQYIRELQLQDSMGGMLDTLKGVQHSGFNVPQVSLLAEDSQRFYLVLRGTDVASSDVAADLNAKPSPLFSDQDHYDFQAHTGALGRARFMLPIARALAAQALGCGKSLVVAGHSLGSGVATILGVLLLHENTISPDRLRVVGLGSMPTVSPSMKEYAERAGWTRCFTQFLQEGDIIVNVWRLQFISLGEVWHIHKGSTGAVAENLSVEEIKVEAARSRSLQAHSMSGYNAVLSAILSPGGSKGNQDRDGERMYIDVDVDEEGEAGSGPEREQREEPPAVRGPGVEEMGVLGAARVQHCTAIVPGPSSLHVTLNGQSLKSIRAIRIQDGSQSAEATVTPNSDEILSHCFALSGWKWQSANMRVSAQNEYFKWEDEVVVRPLRFLLLGATGVGKTTLMGAIRQQMTKDAPESGSHSVVPDPVVHSELQMGPMRFIDTHGFQHFSQTEMARLEELVKEADIVLLVHNHQTRLAIEEVGPSEPGEGPPPSSKPLLLLLKQMVKRYEKPVVFVLTNPHATGDAEKSEAFRVEFRSVLEVGVDPLVVVNSAKFFHKGQSGVDELMQVCWRVLEEQVKDRRGELFRCLERQGWKESLNALVDNAKGVSATVALAGSLWMIRTALRGKGK